MVVKTDENVSYTPHPDPEPQQEWPPRPIPWPYDQRIIFEKGIDVFVRSVDQFKGVVVTQGKEIDSVMGVVVVDGLVANQEKIKAINKEMQIIKGSIGKSAKADLVLNSALEGLANMEIELKKEQSLASLAILHSHISNTVAIDTVPLPESPK